MVCVDTNFLIAFTKKKPSINEFLHKMSEMNEQVYITIFSLAELYFGAYNSKKISSNLETVKKIESAFLVLDFDHKSSQKYGEIYAELKIKGTQIGVMDTLIASIALTNDQELVTNDDDFTNVPSLRISNY